MHVEQNPQGPDELTMRLLALREVSAGIALPPAARIRAAGTRRRRRRTLVAVTSAALAAAAVAFLVTNPSDRRQAVPPPPATQVPVSTTVTSPTSESAETLKVGGNPNLILPRDRVDPLLFVAPEVWADTGLGSGREIAWQAPFNYDAGYGVYPCDQDAQTTGKVGHVDFATDREPLGRLKVRDLGSRAAARTYYEGTVETLAGCEEAAAIESERSGPEMTVRRFDSLAIDTGERAMEVYEFNNPLDEPLIEYVAVGYTASGRFMAVRVNGSALAGALKNTGPEVVAQIGEAELNRLTAVTATAPATTSTTTTTEGTETLEVGGDPDLILPPDPTIDPLLFLPASAWRHLGRDQEPAKWHAMDDWSVDGEGDSGEGSVELHICDTDTKPTGAVGFVGIETRSKIDGGQEFETDILGFQKVRVAAGPAAARALLEQAVQDLGTCSDRVAGDSGDNYGDVTDVTVEEFGDGAGDARATARVFRVTRLFSQMKPTHTWVGLGVSGDRFTVLDVEAASAKGDDVAELLAAAVQRLAAVP